MNINKKILEKIDKSGCRVLAVTKYFDPKTTQDIWKQLKDTNCVLALGENRIHNILDKKLPRNAVHFVGNIQSRKIADIVKYCSAIHSLCDLNHAMILDKEIQRINNNESYGIFLQINISQEPQKSGVLLKDFPLFLQEIKKLQHLEILGISAIGTGEFNETEKRKEFQKLNEIRDDFLPNKEISAGTSRDYEIALEEGIDIIRVGQALFGI